MGCESSRNVQIALEPDSTDNQPTHRSFDSNHDAKKQGPILTEIQIDIINSTWPLLAEDKVTHGMCIFMDIFLVEPKIKALFKLDSEADADLIRNDGRIQGHVSKFMSHIDNVCSNLDVVVSQHYDSVVIKDLLLLGAHHATIPGFEFIYFGIFVKCLHLTWERVLREEYTEEVRDTWAALFEFIISKIQEGYRLYYEDQQPHDNHLHLHSHGSARLKDDSG